MLVGILDHDHFDVVQDLDSVLEDRLIEVLLRMGPIPACAGEPLSDEAGRGRRFLSTRANGLA